MIFRSAPAGSHQRALFYQQLSTLLEAGLPIFSSLEQLARNPPSAALRGTAVRLLEGVRSGRSFTESFQELAGWVPEFDVALVRAGEHSGRLDQAFATLARHHEAQAANWRIVMQEAAYPALVLHLAVFIVPLPMFFQTGNAFLYLANSLGVLAVGYLLAGGVIWATRPGRNRSWRALMESLLVRVPVLGAARSDLALSRLAGALEALLSAGVLVTEAWPMAARASGSCLLERTVETWREPLRSGLTPAQLVESSGLFPDHFASSYSTGEVSGRLEEQLRRLTRMHEEEGFRKLRIVSQWSPRLFYGLVSIWIAFQILAMAGGYVATLNQLLSE